MHDNTSPHENTALLELNITGSTGLIELTAQVNQICQQAEAMQAMLCIRLTDCAFNMSDLANPIHIQDVNRWEQAVRRIERLPSIVITIVSGTLTGPTFDLFLASDYRIARNHSRFDIPSNQGQVWPGMLIHRLVQQIGMTRCRQLLMGTHDLTVEYARTIGLIDEISDNSHLISSIAARFSPLASKEFSIRRQLMLEAATTSFEEALGTHLAACDRELRRLCGWKPFDPQEDNP